MGQEMTGVLLIFPLVLEEDLKCREIYNGGIMEGGEPLSRFPSKALGEYTHLDIVVVYIFEVRPIFEPSQVFFGPVSPLSIE